MPGHAHIDHVYSVCLRSHLSSSLLLLLLVPIASGWSLVGRIALTRLPFWCIAMSEQEAALLASSGAAEAEAEARSEGEVSASGPADTEAVEGVQRPGPGRFKEQTGWTWLLTLDEDYASKAQQLFDACEDKRAGARRKPAVEGVEIGPNQEIMLVWKWLAAYKGVARWLKPLLDECGIPVKATILKSADAAEGRTAQRETPAARSGVNRPAVRRPSAKIKARSSPLESPAPAAASSGAHRPAAAEPKRKRPRRRLPVPDEPGEPGAARRASSARA